MKTGTHPRLGPWTVGLSAIVLGLLCTHAVAEARQDAASVVVGGLFAYEVRAGETLASIGARHGVDPAVLAQQNGLAANDALAIGRTLWIDNRHIVPAPVEAGGVVINIPQRLLFFRERDGGIESYPVAVGRPDWPTPTREFVIQTKEENPTWDVPPSILEEAARNGRAQQAHVPPGPRNPLGAFWLGLSLSGIGIHGTNAPASIFRAITHGCIRMHPDDIARLFERVALGARGRIIYEPVLVADQGGHVYLEVNRDVYRRAHAEARRLIRGLAQTRGVADRIDWTRADAVAAARQGVARDVDGLPSH